jgi:hypothetical protein
MLANLFALLLWGLLSLSVVLTVVGIWRRSPTVVVVAAVLSGVFAVLSLASIGLLVMLGTCLQLTIAFAIRHNQPATQSR